MSDKQHRCIRCNEAPATVRMLCTGCDFECQTMHYSVEYRLFGKTSYMVEEGEPQWFVANKYELTKPFAPKRRGLPMRQDAAPQPVLTG